MPLIPCPECRAEISDAAPTCPKCGNPMQSRVVTTQQTGRIWKAAQGLGVVMAVLGVVACTTADSAEMGVAGGTVSLTGFGVFLAARIGAWWRHG